MGGEITVRQPPPPPRGPQLSTAKTPSSRLSLFSLSLRNAFDAALPISLEVTVEASPPEPSESPLLPEHFWLQKGKKPVVPGNIKLVEHDLRIRIGGYEVVGEAA